MQFLTPWHIASIIFYFFLIIICIDEKYSLWYLRWVSYVLSIVIFIYSLFFLFSFIINSEIIQFSVYFTFSLGILNNSKLGIDGISLFFILLTTFIIPICFLVSWNISLYLREYILCFLMIEFFLILAFSVDDLFLFFVIFESILIPMFLIIGVWGSRPHKTIAAYWFFFFTLAGSVFFLFAISFFYFSYGTTNLYVISYFLKNGYLLDFDISRLIWICLFLTFAVKIPLFPFHVWLPEAHVEAPTAGSVLLASLLLKLGGYGILRFLLNLFPTLSIYFTPFVYTLCFLGIFYTSIIAIRQLDLKRLIAYSSVAHMNYVVLGLFSFSNYGIIGAVQLMLSHGIVSTALFILVGILYDRYGIRLISYYSGLTAVMPFFSFFLGLFIFSNAGFPMLSNFPGEILIFTNFLIYDLFFAFLILLGLYFTGVYSVWLLNRIIFGTFNIFNKNSNIYFDLTKREFFILFILSFLNFFMGFYPNFFFLNIAKSVYFNQIVY